MLDFFHARSSESCCWSIFSNRMYGQSILLLVFNKWQLLLVCMCARNSAKGGYSNRREPTLLFGGKTKFLCHSWTEIWRQVQVAFNNWHCTLFLGTIPNYAFQWVSHGSHHSLESQVRGSMINNSEVTFLNCIQQCWTITSHCVCLALFPGTKGRPSDLGMRLCTCPTNN